MDVGKSFTYMFEDPNWVVKLVIGGAILLVGALFSWLILSPLMAALALTLGYSLVVTKNVADGSTTPLPEWNDFGALLVKGLTGLVGIIIWFIPVIIVGCCIGIVNGVLASAAANAGDSGQAAGRALGIVSACLSCLIAIVSLVEMVTLYAPLTRFALNGQLSVFWDFSGDWAFIQANLTNYIIAVILTLVASVIASVFTICIIGVFLTFWANLVGAHLFGQVVRGQSASNIPPMTPYTPPPMTPTAGV